MRKRLTPWDREWNLLLKRELQFLNRQEKGQKPLLNQKLEGKVPVKLEETLHKAFSKSFALVFLKGVGVIEKTYQKEKQQDQYKVNAYAAGLKEDKRTLRAFHRQSVEGTAKGFILSGIEGIGLGALGIGVPDIPLFTGMLLRSIYQIAISYGYSYDTDQERLFILKVIKTALTHGDALYEENLELNGIIEKQWEDPGREMPEKIEEQIEETANQLAEELLYMKFLQGIPIAGVVGGISDAVYLKKISDYAAMKYKRRFLIDRKKNSKHLEIE